MVRPTGETRRHKPDDWQGRVSRPRFIWLFDVYPRPTSSTIPLRGSRTYAHARPRSPRRELGVERAVRARARLGRSSARLVHLLRRIPQVRVHPSPGELPCALRRLRAEEDCERGRRGGVVSQRSGPRAFLYHDSRRRASRRVRSRPPRASSGRVSAGRGVDVDGRRAADGLPVGRRARSFGSARRLPSRVRGHPRRPFPAAPRSGVVAALGSGSQLPSRIPRSRRSAVSQIHTRPRGGYLSRDGDG